MLDRNSIDKEVVRLGVETHMFWELLKVRDALNELCKNGSITIDKFKFGNKVDFMDLYIYKGNDFYSFGKLDICVFQKEENKYMYIPNKSRHQKHTIHKFVQGELQSYMCISTQELVF